MRLGIYKHFKGNEYRVLGLAKHSETLDELVVYQQLTDHGGYKKGHIWLRPVEMFDEYVQLGDVKVKRFEFDREE